MDEWLRKIASWHVLALWCFLFWMFVCVYHLAAVPVVGITLAKGATLVGGVIFFVLAVLVAALTAVGGVSISEDLNEALFVGSVYALLAAGVGVVVAAPFVGVSWGWTIAATAVAVVAVVAALVFMGTYKPTRTPPCDARPAPRYGDGKPLRGGF